MKRYKEVLLVATMALLPKVVLAADKSLENLKSIDRSIGGPLDPEFALDATVGSILDRLPFFLTALAFASFLYSGGMYIFAMGDATKMENAKKNLTWTAFGMIAMSSVVIIVKLISKFAGTTSQVGNVTDLIK